MSKILPHFSKVPFVDVGLVLVCLTVCRIRFKLTLVHLLKLVLLEQAFELGLGLLLRVRLLLLGITVEAYLLTDIAGEGVVYCVPIVFKSLIV